MQITSLTSKPWLAVAALLLAGCSGLPTAPQTAVRYDLGRTPVSQVAKENLPAVALAPIQAPLWTDSSTSLRYRLAYADPQVLYTYGQARWSIPPAAMIQQRMREYLGQGGRVVLSADPGEIPPLVDGQQVPVLRLSLEEFSQVFNSPQASDAWVRIRATVVKPSIQGDVLLAQQAFEVRKPTATADASGGVDALAQGVNELGQLMQPWLQEVLNARR